LERVNFEDTITPKDHHTHLLYCLFFVYELRFLQQVTH